MSTPSLDGRIAYVIGAGSDAARAIALAFADAGADIGVTTATTDAEEAFAVQRLARSITAKGRRSQAEAIDMSLGANVQVAVRQLSKALGPPDILVTAPEARLAKPSERLTDAEWARVLNLNLSAVFYACRGVAREMLARELPPGREADRGRIIVVVSSSRAGAEVGAAYIAATEGVRALVQALDAEWRDRGLRVSLLEAEPGGAEEIASRALMLAAVYSDHGDEDEAKDH